MIERTAPTSASQGSRGVNWRERAATTEALTEFTLLEPIAGWPVLKRIAVETATRTAYQHGGLLLPQATHWTFQQTLSGVGEIDLGSGWVPLPAGACFLVRRNDPVMRYRLPPTANVPWRFWFCAFAGAGDLVDGLCARGGRIIQADPRHGGFAALMAMAGPGRRHAFLTSAESARLVTGMLAALAEALPGLSGTDCDLADALLARLGDPGRPPGIQQMALRLGVSREHLSRVCRQRLGMPLKRYLLRRQMLHACSLLGQPDMSVTRVSRMLGFDRASHFARSFKVILGVNPSVVQATGGIPPGC